MTLGIPTLIEFSTVREHLAFARKNGFSFFEMNLSFPWFQSDKLDPDLAKRVDAKRFTLHLQYGMYSSVNGTKIYAYEVKSDEYLSHVEKMAELVSKRLEGSDTFFCIENTKGFLPYHKKAIDLMMKYPNFGLTFDVGHNFKASEDDESFILSYRDKVKHFHIHDVNPKSNHMALGDGVMDIDHYLEMVEMFEEPAVLEVKETTALEKSLKYIENNRR